ncbi:MAG TPA: ATP-binding protein [Solirubrobacteraceae bacterium]|nr:ATP-binding protein [Solirubrobacteraceae bacterium]
MDPTINPYSMGAGNPPPALTGREIQEEEFRILLARLSNGMSERSMIVSGLRGVGKTVLLLEFEGIAGEAGWTTSPPIEIRSDTDLRGELANVAYQALLQLSARRALGDRLRWFTGLLRGFKVGASTEGNVEFSFDPQMTGGATGNLERDLTILFKELGQTAAERKTGVLFLIDEMQFLGREELEAVAAAMHRMSQRQLPVALVGAGLPPLPGLMVEAKSYAERLFAYPKLGPLSEEAARQALAAPADARGVAWDEEALAHIVRESGCYPAFIQAYGKAAWNAAPHSPIRLADVLAAEALVLTELDDEFFHVRFEKASDREREYMAAMADLGEGPLRTADVAKRLARGVSSTSSTRDALIKKGLIYSPGYGEVAFTVPKFSPFMRRRYPLA